MFCYYFHVHNSLQWSTVDYNEAATAAETAEGRDSINTAYVGRRWYTSWSKTNAAMMTSRARAGEQQLVSSSSILSIAATTTSADGTVTSQDDLNGAPVPNSDEAQWWRQWRQLSLQHECERLQTLVDSHTRKKTNGNGTGKNKQTMSLTDTANMSNKTALMSCTKDSIWPSYKFLFFRGRWNVYDTICPHAFAAHVMNYVQLPQSFVGYEDLYYESFALPTVSSKLSSLRGNFVTKCRNTFNSEYHY